MQIICRYFILCTRWAKVTIYEQQKSRSHCTAPSHFVGIFYYHIRPNYHTVHLGFSKLLGTLICGKICLYLLRIHYKKRSEKDLFDDDYVIFSDFLYKGICFGY